MALQAWLFSSMGGPIVLPLLSTFRRPTPLPRPGRGPPPRKDPPAPGTPQRPRPPPYPLEPRELPQALDPRCSQHTLRPKPDAGLTIPHMHDVGVTGQPHGDARVALVVGLAVVVVYLQRPPGLARGGLREDHRYLVPGPDGEVEQGDGPGG